MSYGYRDRLNRDMAGRDDRAVNPEPIVILSVLAASLMMYAGAPDTALAYAEAKARAEKYEDDAVARNWRATQMGPVLQKAITPILDACVPVNSANKPNFSVVVSYRTGTLDSVRFTSDDPRAACIADRLAGLTWPAPPYPDFAEEIHLNLGEGK